MQITLTWQGIVTAFAVVGAVVGFATYFSNVVRWVDKQNEQDDEIKKLKQHHEDDINGLKEEQALLIEGVLACLKGLSDKGCNGPVTKAIEQFETYLNKKAHQ
jgi:ABC-type taurine transport system substrate-binding protein